MLIGLLLYQLLLLLFLYLLFKFQYTDQIRSRLISELTKSISRSLQKLLMYFNGAAISPFTVLALPILFVNLDLALNYSESLSPGSSLEYCYKLPEVFAQLKLRSIKLYIGIHNIKIFVIIYLGIICFADALSKLWWCTGFDN